MITDRPGAVITESAPALDDEALAAVARESHPAAITLARDEMISSLPFLILGFAAAVAGMLVRELRLIHLPGLIAAMWGAGHLFQYYRVVRQDPVERWRSDLRRNRELTRSRYDFELRKAAVTPWMTYAFIGVMVIVMLVEGVTRGSSHAVPAVGLVKPAVRAGEWWRLLTAAFVHANGPHVTGNIAALFSLARLVELFDRRWRIPLVFLVSALGCSLASVLLLKAPSLGASGGIVGLGGYLLASAGTRDGGPPEWIRKQMWMLVASLIVTGIVGYRYIDNAGHAGGLIAGALVGLVLRPRGDERSATVDLAGWLSTMILVATAAFTSYCLLTYVSR